MATILLTAAADSSWPLGWSTSVMPRCQRLKVMPSRMVSRVSVQFSGSSAEFRGKSGWTEFATGSWLINTVVLHVTDGLQNIKYLLVSASRIPANQNKLRWSWELLENAQRKCKQPLLNLKLRHFECSLPEQSKTGYLGQRYCNVKVNSLDSKTTLRAVQ